MKKITDNVLLKSMPIEKNIENQARIILKKTKYKYHLIKEIIGFSIGSLDGKPYILLNIKDGTGEKLEHIIPDIFDNLEVYYMEGTGYLQ